MSLPNSHNPKQSTSKMNVMPSEEIDTTDDEEEYPPFERSKETDLCLLKSMIGLKPAGINKFLNVLLIREKMSKELKMNVPSKFIHKYLNENWDMKACDTVEGIPSGIKKEPFALPSEYKGLIEEEEKKLQMKKKIEEEKEHLGHSSGSVNVNNSSVKIKELKIGKPEMLGASESGIGNRKQSEAIAQSSIMPSTSRATNLISEAESNVGNSEQSEVTTQSTVMSPISSVINVEGKIITPEVKEGTYENSIEKDTSLKTKKHQKLIIENLSLLDSSDSINSKSEQPKAISNAEKDLMCKQFLENERMVTGKSYELLTPKLIIEHVKLNEKYQKQLEENQNKVEPKGKPENDHLAVEQTQPKRVKPLGKRRFSKRLQNRK